ncbi:hypothetical protein AAJ76_8200011095 [Vairimorpha ceranae]|uniref:Uncharacterized protein n=1 Tax=Vairimorpha ceranae TaxID=40302 RepID=A0A0F9WMQ4_9MICR|nr:hypothetical protein AAJ76_8200011095 [Vairimorpha ceranae]KKO74333.1 hypothetical protein AAJ76_8200011095 [Vairimorpha ceranae]
MRIGIDDPMFTDIAKLNKRIFFLKRVLFPKACCMYKLQYKV